MPVLCEFIDIIIPIEKIDEVYPGGFSAYKEKNLKSFGINRWNDDYILKQGAMGPERARSIIEYWESLGLIGEEVVDGIKRWKDICAFERFLGCQPCDWLEYDSSRNCISLMGKSDGPVIGPDKRRRSND